jgi:hypothetical protein
LSEVLHHTGYSTIARFVNDGVQEEKVLILYSDEAAYILKAATALKVLYPNTIRLICLSRGLQSVVEEVRAIPPSEKLILKPKSVS